MTMFVNVLVCPVASQLVHLVSDLMEAVIVCCTVARHQLSLEWKHEKREITATRLECNKHGGLCVSSVNCITERLCDNI